MSTRRTPRLFVVALTFTFALSVLAGTGLGFALTTVPSPATVALGR